VLSGELLSYRISETHLRSIIIINLLILQGDQDQDYPAFSDSLDARLESRDPARSGAKGNRQTVATRG
jgi:hypothetical protein